MKVIKTSQFEANRSVLTPEQFPILMPLIKDPKRVEWFTTSLKTLNTATAEGKIYNPLFGDIKRRFDYSIGEAAKHISNEAYARWHELKQPQGFTDGFNSYMALSSVNSCLKKLMKTKKLFKEPILDKQEAFLKELLPLVEAMSSLKDNNLILKGRPPNPNAKPIWEPPPSAMADIKVVSDLLEEITVNVYEDIKAGFQRWNNGIFETFWKAYEAGTILDKHSGRPSQSPSYDFYDKFPDARMLVEKCLDYGPHYLGGKITKNPDFQQILDADAEKGARAVQEAFVDKNTRKLAPIIAAKMGLLEAKVVNLSVTNAITGTISLVFKDKSSFVVQNSVVQSSSMYGKPFFRFPTTFHNVMMPDGKPMGMPSEERMYKVFAGVEVPNVPDNLKI